MIISITFLHVSPVAACCGVVATMSATEARYTHLNEDYKALASQHLINVIPEYSQVCQRQPVDAKGCYNISTLEALEHVKTHGVVHDIVLPFEGRRTEARPDDDAERVYIDHYKVWRADEVLEVLNHGIPVIGDFKVPSRAIFSVRVLINSFWLI